MCHLHIYSLLRQMQCFLLASLVIGYAAYPLFAAAPSNDAVVVEEDYRLVLGEVAPQKCSPQFVSGFPLGNGVLFLITWNHHDSPGFVAGGVQLQMWDGDTLLDDILISENPLDIDGDTVRWKQTVQMKGQDCELRIAGVNAQAWGTNINSSSISFPNAGVANFNNYVSGGSATEAGIGFGKNRVVWYGITEVRKYNEKGQLISKDTTPKVIYQQ